jgi:NADH-quinone oxidoreductase subunit J
MGHPVVFIILAAIMLGSAVGMITSHNAVHSALFLVLNFVTIAVFYIILNAPFIAMVQVTVYAGAIVVLFLFVIMLLGAEQLRGAAATGWQFYGAIVLGLIMLALLLTRVSGSAELVALPEMDASPEAIGTALFGSYVFPFEVTSILLLVAMMSLVIWQSYKREEK